MAKNKYKVSKSGFMFPSALALNNVLNEFDDTVLKKLASIYKTEDALVEDIAKVHTKLLFIQH